MNHQSPSTNNQKGRHPFDLEERTFQFGKEVIFFVSSLPHTNVLRPIVSQLVRSGTSVGANYFEANETTSKRDFLNKITISKKEAKETQYWLRMISEIVPDKEAKARQLWKEVQELNLIFASIIKKSKSLDVGD